MLCSNGNVLAVDGKRCDTRADAAADIPIKRQLRDLILRIHLAQITAVIKLEAVEPAVLRIGQRSIDNICRCVHAGVEIGCGVIHRIVLCEHADLVHLAHTVSTRFLKRAGVQAVSFVIGAVRKHDILALAVDIDLDLAVNTDVVLRTEGHGKCIVFIVGRHDINLRGSDIKLDRKLDCLFLGAAGHGCCHEEVILALRAKFIFAGTGVVNRAVPVTVGQCVIIADRQHRIRSLCTRDVCAEQLWNLRCRDDCAQRRAGFIRHLDTQSLCRTEHTEKRERLFHSAIAVRREGNVRGIDFPFRRDAGNELSGTNTSRGIASSFIVNAFAGIAGCVNDVFAAVPVAVECQNRQTQIFASVAVQYSKAFYIVIILRGADIHRRIHAGLAACRNGYRRRIVCDLRTRDLLDRINIVRFNAVGIERIGSQRVGLRLCAVVSQGHSEAGCCANLLERSTTKSVARGQNTSLCRAERIDHTRALLTNRIWRRAVGLADDISRVHQRKLQILIDTHALQRQFIILLRILDCLKRQRRTARDIGRRHAGATHRFIAVAGRD